uniref:ELMO domain-containing protein n=1 Tax=Spongospora subterranea TaxID=70186 RepID=A0A0H5QZS2_9EUKA|eukprot:CRZ01074.1 hypothetical protein [Spongospora subterranea]
MTHSLPNRLSTEMGETIGFVLVSFIVEYGDKLLWRIRELSGVLPPLVASVLLIPASSFIKFILRLFSGQCELTRIALGPFSSDSDRLYTMECALNRSKAIRGVFIVDINTNILDQANIICKLKHISCERTLACIIECLQAIQNVAILVGLLNSSRRTAYDVNDKLHEDMLAKLWKLLRPGVALSSRNSSDWGQIGFQGRDPATDFRGNGILGLTNLVDFAEQYPVAKDICDSYRADPVKMPSFAICGISLTSDAIDLVTSGECSRFFYERGGANMQSFTRLYAQLWLDFDRTWTEIAPNDVMSFSFVHERFMHEAKRRLKTGAHSVTLNYRIKQDDDWDQRFAITSCVVCSMVLLLKRVRPSSGFLVKSSNQCAIPCQMNDGESQRKRFTEPE